MDGTIESFVAKLKSEGIEEGQREAENLRGEAQKEAEIILSDAKARAEKIVSDAQMEAESRLARGRTEMELAARDAVLKLRSSLQETLESVLKAPVESQLNDAEFLSEVIQSVLMRYIQADIDSYAPMTVNVTPEMHKQLCDWAVNKLRVCMQDDTGGVDFKENLRQAGFELSLQGSTIEITTESVVDTLMQLVGPSLREILNKTGSIE